MRRAVLEGQSLGTDKRIGLDEVAVANVSHPLKTSKDRVKNQWAEKHRISFESLEPDLPRD